MSAAIKDVTSCCSEEADPSAARVSLDGRTGANVYVHALECTWLWLCVCVCVCVCPAR